MRSACWSIWQNIRQAAVMFRSGRLPLVRRYPKNIWKALSNCLCHENILLGVRGKGGGYRLNGEPDQFTVRRILEITEGSLAPVACLAEPHTPCARMVSCRTYPMWSGLNKLICDYLESYTIADLMRTEDAGFDYVI